MRHWSVRGVGMARVLRSRGFTLCVRFDPAPAQREGVRVEPSGVVEFEPPDRLDCTCVVYAEGVGFETSSNSHTAEAHSGGHRELQLHRAAPANF